MVDIPLNEEAPSGSKLRGDNLLLREVYRSLVEITGQTNPIYLSNEVFRHAMNTIAEAKSGDPRNLKNYGIGLQKN
ncbi:hypothetical protein [Photobacterium leiognathi]|uniref:hypothetical protein n=1 Tax=Photobacterium leiognathi TaxID=553611 RepID=UPI0027389842|nr:hypothetical protein [Photobacterium leiognathi]